MNTSINGRQTHHISGSVAQICPPNTVLPTLPGRALPTNALSEAEKKELLAQESVIQQGWKTFVQVGSALQRIRDQKLYRADHQTFEAYCRNKWQYAKSQTYRLIGAAQVISFFPQTGEIPVPTNEAQVRPLIGLDREKAKSAWLEALAKAGKGKVTARLVQSVVDAQLPKTDLNALSAKNLKARSSNSINADPSKLLQKIERSMKPGADKQILLSLLKEVYQFLKAQSRGRA